MITRTEVIAKCADNCGDVATDMFVTNPSSASWIMGFLHDCMEEYQKSKHRELLNDFGTYVQINIDLKKCGYHPSFCDEFNELKSTFLQQLETND